MLLLLSITLILAAIGWSFTRVKQVEAERERDKYKARWHYSLSERGAEDSLIYEWSNRDLMPEWEDVYPHVKHMPTKRKYSEWATFCANYPTRESIIAQLSLEGAARRMES